MAMLVEKGRDRRIALSAHGLVGRSPACAIRLDAARASAEHARISYQEGAWTVRDLGSRNGTYVNGERLAPGGTRALAAGDRLAFGDKDALFELADVSPPVAMARHLGTDALIPGGQGLLALPSPDEPTACVVESSSGAWLLEREGQTREAQDGEIIEAGGERFMLHLPVPLAVTVEAGERGPRVEDAALRFRVSRDEEAVELAVVTRGRAQVLPPRSHHYMLLTLARAMVRDREEKGLAAPQRGWVFVDDLCRMLSTDENKLNVEIYRVRQEMGALGLENAAALIERRRGSRQLRVGTEAIAIEAMT